MHIDIMCSNLARNVIHLLRIMHGVSPEKAFKNAEEGCSYVTAE